MNINEENKDLIENRIPFGLLDKETKERMKAWEHNWESWDAYKWSGGNWITIYRDNNSFFPGDVYRAKPAPVRKECFIYKKLNDGGIGVFPLNKTPLQGGKALWKITYDEDGGNPTLEVLDGNK